MVSHWVDSKSCTQAAADLVGRSYVSDTGEASLLMLTAQELATSREEENANAALSLWKACTVNLWSSQAIRS